MRIVVNDIAASEGGAMSVLRDFYNTVCADGNDNEWIFLLNDHYFEETEHVKILTLPHIKKSRLRKLIFDFITGRNYIKKLKPDVVFSLQNIITFGLKSPQAVYIHQSIPFQSEKRFSFLKTSERSIAVVQYLIGRIIKMSAKYSDCVIVQTNWMKEAVCKLCHLPENKAVAILPCIQYELPTDDEICFDRTSFFYPTSDNLYKNNDCLRKASAHLERIGVRHHITMTLPPEKSEGSVTCTGRLPYADVMRRYQSATLVFPSYIETFGYPLAEARQAGTIILASDTAFSHEVLNGYENAHYFDPFAPEELAELMKQIIQGDIQKKSVQPSVTVREVNNGWQKVILLLLSLGKKSADGLQYNHERQH